MYKLRNLSLVLLLIWAVSVDAEEIMPDMDKRRTKALIRKAEYYIKQHGRDAAIAEFNKKDGIFTKKNLYIFAVTFEGLELANPYKPEIIGTNVLEMKDAEGKPLIRNLIAKAKAGGGWIQYRWKDPVTSQVLCKKSYIASIDNSYFIGSGSYGQKLCMQGLE